jgi:hypothetical protein
MVVSSANAERAPVRTFKGGTRGWVGFIGLLFWWSEHHRVSDVCVALFDATGAETEAVLAKVGGAIELVQHYDPRAFEVIVREVRGVFAFVTAGAYAEWDRRAQLIVLREAYLLDPATTSLRLASTLVHEAMHVWIDRRLGSGYAPERRGHVESLCFKRQLRFVRRAAPADAGLIAELESQIRRDPGYLTNEMFRRRVVIEVLRLGCPRWIIATFDGGGRMLSSFRRIRVRRRVDCECELSRSR